MNGSENKESSAFTKMKQVYWEARQSFNRSLGLREDTCIIYSDSELDIRLDLLRAADDYFNTLMMVLLDYRDALQNLSESQSKLGIALIEHGTKDTTAAGKVMCLGGKAINKSAQRLSLLRTSVINLFSEVRTFQFKATSDALQTVSKMERIRRSYRSSLMWLKNESKSIDPDESKKLRNFKKVQDHIKRLKVRFDGMKLETMQKIDLFLLSRSNLFSQALIPYCRAFKKVTKHSVMYTEYALKNVPLHLSYNFVTLKDLNQYSKSHQIALQQQLIRNRESDKLGEKKISLNEKSPVVQNNVKPHTRNVLDDCVLESSNKNILPTNEDDSPIHKTHLIDLNEAQDNEQSSTTAAQEMCTSVISKYSDDLLAINLGNSLPHFHDAYSLGDYHKFPFSRDLDCQQPPDKGTDELQFWSLIQTFDKTSRLQERNSSQNKGATLVPTKLSTAEASDSKWNDILVQFDPFTDDDCRSKCKKKTKNMESC